MEAPDQRRYHWDDTIKVLDKKRISKESGISELDIYRGHTLYRGHTFQDVLTTVTVSLGFRRL